MNESKKATMKRQKARADAIKYGKLPRRLKKQHKKNLETELRTASGFVFYRWRVRYSPERGWWVETTPRTRFRYANRTLV